MATPKSKLDLSSIGWEYCEVRGKRFSDLLAVKLRLRPNITRGVKIASADKSALVSLGFALVGSELERTTPSSHGTVALTKREISMIFKEFDPDTMVTPGERNTFEPRGEFISFSTHQTISVPQAMVSADHETGKPAGELSDADFLRFVQARTVSLSNLRKLHELLDPDGKFGETAVFHVAEKIRNAFNQQVDATDEIALFAVDGKTFNPPLRIVFDDAVSKPSVFADIQAYRKNLSPKASKSAEKTPESLHEEIAKGIYQKAVDSAATAAKESQLTTPEDEFTLPAPMQRPITQTPIAGRSFVVPKPAARPLPGFASKTAAATKPINVEKADDSVKKMFGGPMERNAPAIQETRFSVREQTAPRRDLSEDQPLSITDFLKDQSLLKMSFHAVLKKIPELFAQYASNNPHVDESFFTRATRMFIREESLRIMAGIVTKQSTNHVKPEEVKAHSNISSASGDQDALSQIEESDLFEVGSFDFGTVVSAPVQTQALPKPTVRTPARPQFHAEKPAASTPPVDDFAQYEKAPLSAMATNSQAAQTTPAQSVARPAGGFMSKLRGSVESTVSSEQGANSGVPSKDSLNQAVDGPATKHDTAKSGLEFSSVMRKASPRPRPNFGQ